MNNIWKILTDHSFTKDEAMDVYCNTLVDNIDQNDLKKITLWYAIKYEIDENKVAINNVLEFINSCFESVEEKLDNILSWNDCIDPNTKIFIKQLFLDKTNSKISLVKANFTSLDSEIKEDIFIDWKLAEVDFLKSIQDLDTLIKKYKSEWYFTMVWPYISDEDLIKTKEIAKDFFWIK